MSIRVECRNGLYVAESQIERAGRGVFTTSHIPARELIEICPVIEVDEAMEKEKSLSKYFYEFGGRLAIALGYGSIYNHSYMPNAIYEKIPEDGVIVFSAHSDIFPDEEITVNYNHGDPQDMAPIIFPEIPSHK